MPRFRGFTGRSSSTTATTPSNDDTNDQCGDKDAKEDVMSVSYPPPKHHPLHLFRGQARSKPRPAQPWTAATTNKKNGNNGTTSDDQTEKEDTRKGHNPLTATQSISMASAYCLEWERLFMVDDYAKRLKAMGMNGELRSSRFRSVCWKMYMECLPENRREWISTTRAWRDRYDYLKQKLIINPRKAMDKADLSINNPLSQEQESPWNQFFQDNELRLTIKQDVIRTFPEIEFFRSTTLREQMLDILFCYAKINEKLMYKQGMHELLAPLIFVLHCDHQAFLHACEIESIDLIDTTERPVVREILNPEYIEHDAFTMFCQIMGTVEPWYVSKEISPTVKNTNIFTAQPFARVQDMHPSNVIITKLTRIQDYVLKRFDPDLHAHLEKMEIAPQIYGIRWVRLLFGREFTMQDLLVVWDAIFADGISFDLVDYIFVGMLQYIRELLLYSDYPSCLTTLMKFPPVGDVHYFVEKAVYLREPTQHPKPRDYVYTKPSQQMTNSQLLERVTKSYSRSGGAMTASVMSSLTSLTRKLNQSRPQHLGLDTSPKKISKSTSEPMNLLTDESPEYKPTEKRGSTASLSKLESGWGSMAALRPAASTQSLAKLETSSVRSLNLTSAFSMSGIDKLLKLSPMSPGYMFSVLSAPVMPHGSAGSVANIDQLSPDETVSPPAGQKYSTLPGRGAKGKKDIAMEQTSGQEIALLMGRLHDMEAMCKQCSFKMGKHIDKLQVEMMRQDTGLQNEDELLLALAGLKQVRDVLKGILKPCNIFDQEEINIRDNYYRDDTSSADATPSSVTSHAVFQSSPEMRRAAHAATFRAVNNIDDDSSPNSSSPEYSDNIRPGEGSLKTNSAMMNSWEKKAEIEMTSLRSDVERLHRQFSNASENGTKGTQGVFTNDDLGSNHHRSYSTGSHDFDLLDPNQNKARSKMKQANVDLNY